MPATAVREKPIDFDGESVRAILEGRKAMTRRVVKFPHDGSWEKCQWPNSWGGQPGDEECWIDMADPVGTSHTLIPCPYPVGTRLVVKEPFRVVSFGGGTAEIIHEADGKRRIVSSVGMPNTPRRVSPQCCPKSARRLWLDVVNVRVERVQDMGGADLVAEGGEIICEGSEAPGYRIGDGPMCDTPAEAFAGRWDSINAKRGYPWESNPYVWVIEFKRVER